MGNLCGNVSKNEEMLDFKCNQFKADTIMFSLYYNICSTDKDMMVVTDATDTNCYAHATEISEKMQGLFALKRKGQLISCNELCQVDLVEIIVQFYTMTECDFNNGFYGLGKNSSFDEITPTRLDN